MSSRSIASPLLAGLLVLGAGAASPALAQAPAGLPIGSCVVTGYGSPAVITGAIPGGYTMKSQYGGHTLRHDYAGVKAVPCPGEAATAAPQAKAAAPEAPAVKAPAAAPKAAVTPAAAPRPAAGGAGTATLGKYHCVLFINGTGLVTQSAFTLLGGGRYSHELGGGGTTKVSGGVIEFTGGPLNGQAGKVSAGRVNLYNASRSRTVIDCDTKG